MVSAKTHPSYLDFVHDVASLCQDKYYEFVFSFSEQHYQERIDMSGFHGGRKVLDAGCGYGQWAGALARCNDHVIGVDRNPRMIEISRRYAERFNVKNAEFIVQKLPELDFADGEFDYIWCWGVLMFVNRSAVLKEFHRLLKPGGRLLVGCCNARGRWLYKLWNSVWSRPKDWRAAKIKVALRTLLRGNRDSMAPNYTTRRSVAALCANYGLRVIAVDFDGHIDLSGKGRRHPMFDERYWGLENNIEFIAEKQ